MSDSKRVLIMAGGTGGHVFPALAVADVLSEKGNQVHWLGTHAGLEDRIVPRAGYPISYISIRGLRGKGLSGWLLAPFRLLVAITQGLRICLTVKPDVVLGMGGFVTGPGGVACRILNKPLVIHEQNAIAGLTNRLLARIANRVLEAFPGTFAPGKKVTHTGNPVRTTILELDKPAQRFEGRDGPIRILVIGGSLGAQALNECVPHALSLLEEALQVDVWHQAGRNKLNVTEKQYHRFNINARLTEFVDDMDAAYAWADLIICRAGAMTVSEISNVGLASILVPYPYAVDDHQTANARYLCDAGAAVLIQQVDLTPERLASELGSLLAGGRQKLLDMAMLAQSVARPNATLDVANHCMEVAR